MVTIVDYAERQNSEGEKFFALILQGGLEMIKSQVTGNYYATAKKASVTSTFTEEFCKSLIGREIPGSVQRVSCEPYKFTLNDTGEILTLEHRWIYQKDGETVEEVVFEGEPESVEAQ